MKRLKVIEEAGEQDPETGDWIPGKEILCFYIDVRDDIDIQKMFEWVRAEVEKEPIDGETKEA